MVHGRYDGSRRRSSLSCASARRLVGTVLIVGVLGLGAGSAAGADGLVVAQATTTGYPTVELSVDAPPTAATLTPGDVLVTEDGAPVAASLSRLVGPGLELVLVVDASRAMNGGWLEQAKVAALQFLERLPPATRVGLVRFGGDVQVLAPPTTDRAGLRDSLGQLVAGGSTPLYDAVVAAGGTFTADARERVVVLLSAGGDFDASEATIDAAAAAVRGAHVEVVSIENPRTSPLALARLAIEGRGDVRAIEPAGLAAAYGGLADALVGRYTITYRSTGHGTVSVGVSSPAGTVSSQLELPPAVAPTPSPTPASTPAPAVPPATTAVPTAPATVVAPPSTLAPAPTSALAPPTTVAPAASGSVAPPTAGPVGTRRGPNRLARIALVAGVLGLLALLAGAARRARHREHEPVERRADAAGAVDGVDDPDGSRFRSLLETRLDRERTVTLDDGARRRPADAPFVVAVADGEPEAYDYARFSELAGPLAEPDGGAEDGAEHEHRVAFRPSLSRRQRGLVMPLLALNMAVATGFYVWLIQPAHLPQSAHRGLAIAVLGYLMLGGIVIIEGMRLVSSFALSWWAWRAHDPVPVRPDSGLRVAFTTTIVPSREPLDVVRRTLLAAKDIEYDGVLDVWLLDEGNDPDVRDLCRELGVRHFTRSGIAKWNRPSGRYRARTKHGNHNAWLAAHGRRYDVEISVDPDHAPLPNICERLLGYFRDPDVAFVCGPQVYGNYRSFLTRAAESQAYLFQSVIQRAANRDSCGMFVGTNHAYRISVWRQIGGFQDSITEDMATSFAVHGARNPDTGNAWKSVYTPDVIAVGEGPATWTDFFSQQLRWARGTDDVLVHGGLHRFRQLAWARRLHYALLCSYYPFVAAGWMLGLLLSAVYVVTGATGLHLTDLRSWFTLYADLALVQTSLYFWLRRLNVSPHEPEGSAGVAGMFVSMLATPVYITALVGAVLRRPLSFVVTPKGKSATTDGLATFQKHLRWAGASLVVIACAFASGRALWAALLAPSICLFVSVTPIVMWLARRERRPTRPTLSAVPAPLRSEEDLVLSESTA